MQLARRAPAAAGNIEGARCGQYPHQQCRRRLRYTRRCSGNSRCEPSLSCRGADLCRHGALVGRCGRSRRNDVQQRWQRVVPERHGGNVRADERLSCVAMADAAIRLAERRWRPIIDLTLTAQRKRPSAEPDASDEIAVEQRPEYLGQRTPLGAAGGIRGEGARAGAATGAVPPALD